MGIAGGHAVNHFRCEALFASTLQQSDVLTPQTVADAISSAIRRLGRAGCTSRMAQDFGDHPEEARDRMRWARQLLGQLSGPSSVAPAVAGLPPDCGVPVTHQELSGLATAAESERNLLPGRRQLADG